MTDCLVAVLNRGGRRDEEDASDGVSVRCCEYATQHMIRDLNGGGFHLGREGLVSLGSEGVCTMR